MIKRRILIIGGGNMGMSIATALYREMDTFRNNLLIITRNKEQSISITKQYGIASSCKLSSLKDDDIIVIAVKPQSYKSVVTLLTNTIGQGNLIISVMAGVSVQSLKRNFPRANIIRAMPNTPATVGKGMTTYYGEPDIRESDLEVCETMFQTIGKILRVDSENLIDSATAISGSGPAYLFYLAESMIDAAVRLGFLPKEADLLVTQTMAGAAQLLGHDSESPRELRKKVTSPNGTTQAACDYFDSRSLASIVIEGCDKAYRRAREIASVF